MKKYRVVYSHVSNFKKKTDFDCLAFTARGARLTFYDWARKHGLSDLIVHSQKIVKR
ncbi:MAG TPA: hypothetical protein VIL78_00725 [Hanamia sp.]